MRQQVNSLCAQVSDFSGLNRQGRRHEAEAAAAANRTHSCGGADVEFPDRIVAISTEDFEAADPQHKTA
jgi:hypothetical protein